MRDKFLSLAGKDVNVEIADIYLNRATNTILRLTNKTLDDITEGLEDLIVDLAVYRYEMRGATHLKSENYDGASFSYNTDIPDFIMTEIKSYRSVRVF